MKVQIHQNQCGFLLKDGCFRKTLVSGTYHYMKALGYEVVIEDMEGSVAFDKVPKEILLGPYRDFEGERGGDTDSSGGKVSVLECVESLQCGAFRHERAGGGKYGQ